MLPLAGGLREAAATCSPWVGFVRDKKKRRPVISRTLIRSHSDFSSTRFGATTHHKLTVSTVLEFLITWDVSQMFSVVPGFLRTFISTVRRGIEAHRDSALAFWILLDKTRKLSMEYYVEIDSPSELIMF